MQGIQAKGGKRSISPLVAIGSRDFKIFESRETQVVQRGSNKVGVYKYALVLQGAGNGLGLGVGFSGQMMTVMIWYLMPRYAKAVCRYARAVCRFHRQNYGFPPF